MKEFLIALFGTLIIFCMGMTHKGIQEKAQKQYTLDSLHYERQEAIQDSILVYQKAMYNDLRCAE